MNGRAEKTKIRYTHWPFWMDKREVRVFLETTGGSWMARGEMCCRSSVFIVYILCHPRSGQRLLFKMATALSQQWHICPVKWNGSIFFFILVTTPNDFYRTLTIRLIASWPKSQRNNCNLLLSPIYKYICVYRWYIYCVRPIEQGS